MNIHELIRSGVENIDSKIGVYASGETSYKTFEELLIPITNSYHKISNNKNHGKIDIFEVDQIPD